jgi:CO/xanthine dehydrogenase Mo-binding subunit/aerobic-type carbon monoxide dehydrogenase small subunit (CoxS/CutS family)
VGDNAAHILDEIARSLNKGEGFPASKAMKMGYGTEVRLTVNGRPVIADIPAETTLLKFLRDHLRLTGAKCGCGVGDCGACTVIVNGEAKKSCLLRMGGLQGAGVETIEGLSADGLHPLQQAFIGKGAIQCGFCTTGMIMAAKALLDRNPSPSRDDIMAALVANYCRCTGYFAIIEAVEEASRVLSGRGAGLARAPADAGPDIIGESVQDNSDVLKATGRLVFSDDLYFDGMCYGALLLSGVPHAALNRVDASEAELMPGVIRVLTARDIPGINRFGIIHADQPVLAEDKVRFVGDPIAMVIADTEEKARKAVRSIRVDLFELPVVSSPEQAMKEPHLAPVHESGHILKKVALEKGDAGGAFAQAALIVEEDYETQFVEHAYLEPESGAARATDDDGVEIWCSTQAPFAMRGQIARCLDLPEEKVRVRGLPVGGGFGGKLDITIQVLLGLGALSTKKPFKITLNRNESLRMSTKKHPFKMSYKTGVSAEGKFLALEAKLVSDAGAYEGWSADVLEQAIAFAGGPYVWPNVRVEGLVVRTNNVLGGAFRGFGMNQVHFAIESQIDIMARKLGMAPIKLRLINALEEGRENFCGEVVKSCVAIKEAFLEAEKRIELLPPAQTPSNKKKRTGVGIAGAYKNIGGGRGFINSGGAVLKLLPSGAVELRASVCDMGQGAASVLAQIAAAVTGISVGAFAVVVSDSDLIPVGAMAIGQRQTMISGNAVLGAAKNFRKLILEFASHCTGSAPEDLEIIGTEVVRRNGEPAMSLARLAGLAGATVIEASFEWTAPQTYPLKDDPNPTFPIMKDGRIVTDYDPQDYRNYFAYNYACQIAVVEVDVATGAVEVKKVFAFHDVGRALNPLKIKGQIEGSIIMGIGYALSEEFVVRRGIPRTKTLRGCGIPDIRVRPEVEVVLVEKPEPIGPFAAKGISEIALVPTVPAVINAIYDAVGVRITSLPATQEKVLAALWSGQTGIGPEDP